MVGSTAVEVELVAAARHHYAPKPRPEPEPERAELSLGREHGLSAQCDDMACTPAAASSGDESVQPTWNEAAALPPVDRGKDAWLFLAASFVVEALVWGFPFVFGVFQDFYSTHEPFAGSPNIAVVGTCAMGVMYLLAPLTMGVQQMFPRQTRFSPIVGLFTMCLSLAMSSFATTVPQLIATQGFLYAAGGSIAYGPCILYMDEWFARRRGLAFGIMWSGTGLAGVILPLLMTHWLDTYGYQTALRIWAVALFVLTAPLSRYIKPRLPYPAASAVRPPLGLGFVLRSRVFALHQLANVVEAMGFFLPTIYLPSYARAALGADHFRAALTVLLVNVASVVGCVGMGSLIDRWHVTTCILVSTVGTVGGTMLLWGLSVNLPVLYVFCVIYGLFAGSYTTCWPGIMRAVTGGGGAAARSEDGANNNSNSRDAATAATAAETSASASSAPTPPASSTMVFAFLAAGRGVGNVLSGPLSEALIKNNPWRGEAAAGYGSGYGPLIVFTGVTAVLGGSSFVWKRIGWL